MKAVAAGGRVNSEVPDTREQLLMTQVAEGDGAAFAELFDGQSPVILGFLVRLLRHRGLAEEVLQETFLQAWLQAGNYRPELGTPRGWLLLIARSRALDCLRREKLAQPARGFHLSERAAAAGSGRHRPP